MDETYYDRKSEICKQTGKSSRLLRVLGTEQWKSRHQRSTLGQAFLRPFLTLVKVPVLISFAYYTFTFAWVVGLNAEISVFLTDPRLYSFTGKDVGQYPYRIQIRLHPF